jgi:WD40 repeat protein
MRLQNIAGRLVDVIFGYDFFLSYTWADGSEYTRSLHEKLKAQGFTVFLDEKDYARGDNWTLLGRRALRKTRQLILIATPKVHESAPVLKELITFQSTSRRIVPIEIGDSLDRQRYPNSPLLSLIPADILRIDQPLQRGAIPSEAPPEVIRELRRGFQHMRQAQIRTRVLLSACLVLLGLLSIAVWQGYLAWANAKEVRLAFSKADCSTALERIRSDQGPEAVAYLCRALRTDRDNHDAAALLFSVLTTRSWIVPQERLELGTGVFRAFDSNARHAFIQEGTTARVWDIDTHRVIREIRNLSNAIGLPVFTPDGKYVIIDVSNSLQKLDIATGLQSVVGKGDRDSYSQDWFSDAFRFSPDGQKIGIGSEDGIQGWTLSDNKPAGPNVRKPANSYDGVPVAISPDGSRLLANGGKTIFWDSTGQLVSRDFEHHPLAVLSAKTGEPLSASLDYRSTRVNLAAFSPNGQWVMAATTDNLPNIFNTIRVWNASSGEMRSQVMVHERNVQAASWSPDSHYILTASENILRVWNAATGRILAAPLHTPDSVLDAWFSPDGARIIAVVTKTSGVDLSAEPGLAAFALNPNGRVKESFYEPKMVFTWGATPVVPSVTDLKLTEWVLDAKFSPDGHWILTTSGKMAQLWDASTHKMKSSLPLNDVPVCALFSPDSRLVLLVSDDETARIWNVTTGQAVTQLMRDDTEISYAEKHINRGVSSIGFTAPQHPDRQLYGAFSPDSKRVALVAGFSARIWDVGTGEPIARAVRHRDYIRSVTFSPDGGRLLTSSLDAKARQWSAATGQAFGKRIHPDAQIEMAAFSPSGAHIVTCADDHSTQVWNAVTGRPVSSIKQQDAVNSVQFSPDGKRIVTMAGSAARVWDALTGLAISAPMTHGAPLTSVSFSPDGNFVLTSSKDQSARIWAATTGLPVSVPMPHESAVNTASFSADEQLVVTGSEDGTVKIWPFYHMSPSAWILDLGESLAGCTLDSTGNPSYLPGKTIGWLRQQALDESKQTDPMVVWARHMLNVSK